MALQIRRGTSTELVNFVPAEGELIYTTDIKKLYVGDGSTAGGLDVSTAGGIGGLLSASINLNGFNIVGTGNLNTTGSLNTTGNIQSSGTITASSFQGQLVGNVIGNLAGSVFGDLQGSVFGSDSSVLVDSINNQLTGPFTGNIVSPITQIVVLDNQAATPVFYGTVSGSVIGDVYGSVLGADSSVLINGDTRTLSNSVITIQDNTISSSDNFIFIKGVNDQTLVFEQRQDSPIIATKTILNSNILRPAKINFLGYKTSIDTPGIPQIGDYIGSMTFSVFEPSSASNAPIGLFSGGIDINGSVSQGFATGKLTLLTIGGTDSANTQINLLTFDSKGQLAINQNNAQATLDVNGFAKLAVLTVEPASPANGMIAIADGTIWNPLTNNKQSMVIRLGGTWVEIASAI